MKKMLISMLAMVAMVSCSSESDVIDEVNPTDAKVPVELKSSILGIETKTINTNGNGFESNTTVGVTLYKGTNVPTSEGLGSPAHSSQSFTVGVNGALSETATPKTMFWERNTKHFFYAYYPIVTEGNTNYTYTAAAASKAELITVSVPTNGETTDLLMAKITNGIEFSGAAITGQTLTFSHMLSKIKFVIRKDKTFEGTGNITKISATLNKDKAVFDMVAQTSENTQNPVTITKSDFNLTPTVDNDVTCAWEPIVIPTSTISDLKFTVDTKELTVANVNATLTAGKITTITVTLKGKEISDINSAVTPWDNETAGSGEII